MARTQPACLLVTLMLAACGDGASEGEPTGGTADPQPAVSSAPTPASTPGSIPAIGETFDPTGGAPAPVSISGTWAETTVNVEDGELRVMEQSYRTGEKKSRRQVRKTAEGIVNHGSFVRWHKNGVVAEEGEYVDGQRVGVFIERMETGQMLTETPYVDGLVHGLKREWSDVGFVKKEAEFSRGALHGSYKIYGMAYEGERFERISGLHDNGLKIGLWMYTYAKGEPRDRGEFLDDLRHGLWTSWHVTGHLQREAFYRAGEYHGEVKEYDEGGHLSSVGSYVDGEQSGPATTWFASGQMESRGEYVDGKQEGEWTFWHEDGSVDELHSGSYRAGERVSTDG